MKTSSAAIDAVLAQNVRCQEDLYTIYLAAGDGGTVRWTGAAANLAWPGNLIHHSEPLLANIDTKSAGITQGALTDGGLSNGAAFPSGATDQWAYETPVLSDGATYTVSAYVKMADLSAPTVNDMRMVLNGVDIGLSLVTLISGSLYRVSASAAVTTGGPAQNCGFVRNAGLSGKAFTVTGFQVVPGSAPLPYVKTTGTAGLEWLATGPIIKLGGGRSTVGLEVAGVQIDLAPGQRTVGGRTIKVAAMQGAFDDVRVLVQRAYMSTWGEVPGLIYVFDGRVLHAEPSSTGLRLDVRSRTSILSREIPKRIIQPQCPYRLYDADTCGVTKATWTSTGLTVAAGSTTKLIKLSAPTALANVGGTVLLADGSQRTISAVSGVDLTLSTALYSVPATGSAVTVSKGCDKTRAGCRGFSNIARFGGFPDTPKPVAVQDPMLGLP